MATRFARLHLRYRLPRPHPPPPYDLWHHLDNKLCGLSPLLPRLLLLLPTPMWIKQMLQLLFLATDSPPTLTPPSRIPHSHLISSLSARNVVLLVSGDIYAPACFAALPLAAAGRAQISSNWLPLCLCLCPGHGPCFPTFSCSIKAIWHWPRAINNNHHGVLTSRAHTYSPASTATKSV